MVKRNFILDQYKQSWDFIKEIKNFIYFSVGIFFIFAISSFFISPPDFVVEQILKFIQELLDKTKDMGHFELTRFIFLNNLQSSFLGVLLGVFLGIFPLIATISNGYLLGFVSSLVVESESIFVLWRLFPHGIFELPAIFISFGMGLKIGTFLFQKNKMDSLKDYFLNSMRVFLFVIIPLLVIAAIIEGSFIFLFS
jgi:stage II sporulation protein M